MKKKILPLALAAATGLVASTAQAVFVNPEGHGQVLLYPYYTVEGGNDTYINVVNTTSEYKAVKVRFLEAMNSQEVLDFNLYLSPEDHWSAVVYANPNGQGAVIKTGDTTCTVPNSLAATSPGQTGPAVAFRTTTFAGDSEGGLDRTREGYVEIIEMGVLEDADDRAAVLHDASGKPGDCSVLAGHFTGTGKWVGAGNQNANVGLPTGGLYGYGVLINVADGTAAAYDAIALDNFIDNDNPAVGGSEAPVHATPGSVLPNLAQATPVAQVLDGSGTAPAVLEVIPNSGNGIDAVSTVLMHNAIMNDYVLEPTVNAGTDWVVNFPTKRAYVNGTDTNSDGILESSVPFTKGWNPSKSEACEEISLVYYNREEGSETQDLDFSPSTGAPNPELCKEVNVITFNNSGVLNASDRIERNLPVKFNNGWAGINFGALPSHSSITGARQIATTSTATGGAAVTFGGLPVVGFAVQKYVNGALNGGSTLANYAGTVTHKATRSISN